MKKILLILTLLLFLGVSLFVCNIWMIISSGPNTTYGHLLLRDNMGDIITDKSRSGGYSLPYTGRLDTELVKSILQIEDSRFYEHHGINIRAKIASIYQNMQAGDIVRGGSTITEQYVKNAYFAGKPRTIIQKLSEMAGAIIIESEYSKDEILRKYLSTVYMGNNLYGIANMLEEVENDDTIIDIITKLRFPNITPSNKITVGEYRNRLTERLGKHPSRIEVTEKYSKKTINIFPSITLRVDSEISLYCSHTENNLSKWVIEIPKGLCETGEKELKLTIDSKLTTTAGNIAKGVLDTLQQKNVTNGSIYIINPSNHHILSYIGSVNSSEQVDMITKSRSVGSLLKPLVYLFALERGADSEDYLLDDKTAYETEIEGKYFIPENYNPKSYGPIRLREALGNSLNAATVRLTEHLGITNIYNQLRHKGLILDHDAGYYGYGISIGTVETTMENIVDTYSSLTDYDNINIWQIGNILSDSRNRAKTFGISSILNTSIPMSVKTGTSTDFRDNWAISYHRDAIIGVWVGNSDGSSMGDVSGVSGAGPIWHNIAEYMIQSGLIKNYTPPIPQSIKQIPICLDTNCFRKELMYTKKTQSPPSRILDKKYFEKDFFGTLTSEEKEKWNIE